MPDDDDDDEEELTIEEFLREILLFEDDTVREDEDEDDKTPQELVYEILTYLQDKSVGSVEFLAFSDAVERELTRQKDAQSQEEGLVLWIEFFSIERDIKRSQALLPGYYQAYQKVEKFPDELIVSYRIFPKSYNHAWRLDNKPKIDRYSSINIDNEFEIARYVLEAICQVIYNGSSLSEFRSLAKDGEPQAQ